MLIKFTVNKLSNVFGEQLNIFLFIVFFIIFFSLENKNELINTKNIIFEIEKINN